MSSGAGTKGVPRAEREEQILDLAAREFGMHGYAGASVATIAQLAGVSKPLIYNYFRSREGLHLACVHRAGERLVPAVRSAQRDVSAAERATATIVAIVTALADRRHDWHLLYDPTLPDTGAVAEAAHGYRKALNEMGAHGVAHALARTGSTDPTDNALLTRIWFGTVTAVIDWWTEHPEVATAEMITRCTRVFALLEPRSPDAGQHP
ncbi:TetR/AcrR family transcriptional regulator [Nocardia sp. NPDC050710]|uniref:TetR/AcrR family transcriptional regulator n=1 Tax=Nocardia sp. NPDC050710 TaxID=3157220 RepID=UPI0033F68EB1